MKKKNANDLVMATARIEAALRHSELADRERLVLHAYVRYEPLHGGACGKPGLCWPTDAELGAYLGRSDLTIRRARRALSAGASPIIAVEHVRPFGRLPNGVTTFHGANVIRLLDITGDAARDESPAALELADADAEVRELEARLARARQRVQAAAGVVAARRRTPHNAPCRTTPDRSELTRERRAGELAAGFEAA